MKTIMKTPYDIFNDFDQLATDAKRGIIKLFFNHAIKKINTEFYIKELGFDCTNVGVYDRKMDAMFYEPLSSVVVDSAGLHLFYNGETSGECYDPTTMDWMNVYSLLYEIFIAIDSCEVDLVTE